MKAMILAAGFGTRLRPLTTVCPKPMFPVLNRPLLEHTLHRLSAQNIREIVINLHHLPEQILDHFGDGSRFGVRLKFSCEDQILGTAGGIKAARKYLNGEPFFVINSDVVAEIDLPRVMEFHRRRRSRLTLVVREDASPEKFDPIEMDGAGRIVH
ncbi:MAG: NTP transferase domain-containing protein, partial [Nitrospinaceae bacterium]|nr:nucleotidyltransferase family protein [Nitrospinaceae bacterium]NIS83767.1 nucleotidyltransferase family protein [Nitrospinaceae bacterium]NIT80566.1 nucleotidyltransferase family protein [Nitrospinaceae bacterium]NIU94963.1 NTP transferase domain-containing protein [Nitrospinaceae bacterium]NIY13588.1 NTP transferase domain-containing protein [Nitrospinaceae bacterium]